MALVRLHVTFGGSGGMITSCLLMLSSSDNGAKGSDGDDYVLSPDALHQTTGPREVMGMITSCLVMLSSSDNGAKGSDGDDYILSPDALFIRQRGQGK